eukprot:9244797-Ditylum_brightwellii.AAC.1
MAQFSSSAVACGRCGRREDPVMVDPCDILVRHHSVGVIDESQELADEVVNVILEVGCVE